MMTMKQNYVMCGNSYWIAIHVLNAFDRIYDTNYFPRSQSRNQEQSNNKKYMRTYIF